MKFLELKIERILDKTTTVPTVVLDVALGITGAVFVTVMGVITFSLVIYFLQ